MIFVILFLFSFQIYSQSQDEILSDLREDNVLVKESQIIPKSFCLEKLRTIYIAIGTAMENKDDNKAIEEANQMEKSGITAEKIKIGSYAELNEEQILYLKIRRLRGEAFYNLREFKNALPDSKFIVENHPRPVVFDYTRYIISLYYLGEGILAKRILVIAKKKFKNKNDLLILQKTDQLLFPEY
jgi:hypothetical protein